MCALKERNTVLHLKQRTCPSFHNFPEKGSRSYWRKLRKWPARVSWDKAGEPDGEHCTGGQTLSQSSWVEKSLASSRAWKISWLEGREYNRKVLGSEVDRWAGASLCWSLQDISLHLISHENPLERPKEGGSLHLNKVDLRTLGIWVHKRKFCAGFTP